MVLNLATKQGLDMDNANNTLQMCIIKVIEKEKNIGSGKVNNFTRTKIKN